MIKDGEKVVVTNATVEVSRYWAKSGPNRFDSAFEKADTVFVTDPLVPPKGIELKKEPLRISEIKEISWIAPVGDNQKVKLVLTDGRDREAFLFMQERDGSAGGPLESSAINVKGKTLLQGKEYEVTLKCGDVKSLAFSRSSGPSRDAAGTPGAMPAGAQRTAIRQDDVVAFDAARVSELVVASLPEMTNSCAVQPDAALAILSKHMAGVVRVDRGKMSVQANKRAVIGIIRDICGERSGRVERLLRVDKDKAVEALFRAGGDFHRPAGLFNAQAFNAALDNVDSAKIAEAKRILGHPDDLFAFIALMKASTLYVAGDKTFDAEGFNRAFAGLPRNAKLRKDKGEGSQEKRVEAFMSAMMPKNR